LIAKLQVIRASILVFLLISPEISAQKQGASSNLELRLKYLGQAQESISPVHVDKNSCGDQQSRRTLEKSPEDGLINAVLWLEGSFKISAERRESKSKSFEIKNCQFQPKLHLLDEGDTLVFSSKQDINFDIRINAKKNPIRVLSLPPNLKEVSYRVRSAEILSIGCALHPWMRAYAVVKNHPYFAITDKEGKAIFNKVPSGKYKVHGWHEKLGHRILEDELEISKKSKRLEIFWPEEP
jgi:hypothetical protein